MKRFFESHPDFPRRKHGEIRQQRVDDIFNHPLYTGYICSETYRLEWLKGQHEALIPLETFDKVQQRIKGTALAPARKNLGDDLR
ncbi:MAG: recombinase family protein [Epibacterium sp.]|nr:recombinase family protein [Epibacterium sp.]NQX75007.1 recombinase family protein [Epibacterium sp.]